MSLFVKSGDENRTLISKLIKKTQPTFPLLCLSPPPLSPPHLLLPPPLFLSFFFCPPFPFSKLSFKISFQGLASFHGFWHKRQIDPMKENKTYRKIRSSQEPRVFLFHFYFLQHIWVWSGGQKRGTRRVNLKLLKAETVIESPCTLQRA